MLTPALTAKQRRCRHPFQNVHPTYDPRWETCDLCHIVRPATPLAPWIEAHDAEQPAPEAPALFADLAPIAEEEPKPAPARESVPARAVPVTVREPAPARITYAQLMRRDAHVLGLAEEPAPPLALEQQQTCPRCTGRGYIKDPTRRRCPRCQGERIIARYGANSAGVARRVDRATA